MSRIGDNKVRSAVVFVAGVALSAVAVGNDAERRDALFNELFSGRGSQEQASLTEALTLWTDLATNGDARSLYYLSFLYFGGLGGVDRDDVKALDLVRASADLGLAEAQYKLGHAYEVGQAVQRDAGEARRWYEHAARQGYWLASERLAGAYERGELGVEPNDDRAAFWRSTRADLAD